MRMKTTRQSKRPAHLQNCLNISVQVRISLLCKESHKASCGTSLYICRLGDELQSLEVRVKEEEVVLTEAFRIAAALNPPHEHPCETFTSTVSTKQPLVQAPAPEVHMDSVCDQKLQLDGQANSSQPNTRSTEQIERLVMAALYVCICMPDFFTLSQTRMLASYICVCLLWDPCMNSF